MSKRALKITAIILLSAGSPAFSTRPVSAQSAPVNAQPLPYGFEYSFMHMDGSRRGCWIYSQAAQSQANDNKIFRCDYMGARWDTSRDTHFWWCRLMHSRTSILAELQNREISLQRCLYRAGRDVPDLSAYRPVF
jgi:hypothetical protein